MHAIHFFPVLFKGAQFMCILVKGCAWKRSKLGYIHIINGQGKDIIHTLLDTRLGFTGQTHHEKSLDTDMGFMDQTYLLCEHLKIRVLPVLSEEIFIACLHAKADHPAAGPLHHLRKIEIDMLRPHRTVKGHSEGRINHQTGEGFNPLAVKGELIIIKVDMSDMKTVLEIFQMFIKIFSGIIPETVPEDGTVTVTARVRTSAARYAARIRDPWIVEDRQLIRVRITVEFFISGKWECIEFDAFRAVAVKKRVAFSVAIDNTIW
jgi:hypothetical protein